MGILMLNGNNYTGGIQQVFGSSSGNIASFDDGGDNKPLKSLKVAINPVQSGSGDPSPINVRPISGWTGANVTRTGKNLFNKATVTSRKGLNASGTLINVDWCSVSDYIAVKPNTAYHMAHGVGNSSLCGGAYYTADKTFIAYINSAGLRDADFSFTTPNNVEYIRLNVTTANLNTAQIELGTTATEYEPYNGQTYTIDLDETRYGGKVDVVSGVMTVDKMQKSISGGFVMASNNVLYIDDMLADGLVNNAVISNYYPFGTLLTSTSGALRYEGQFCLQDVANHGMRYMVYDSNFESASEFNTLLSTTPLQVNYELITPLTIQLTPTQVNTLLGNNNLWSNTGEIVECVYQRDLNLVINQFDERITALEQALNSSGTRSLSLSKSAVKEEETEEITEEPKEEEQNEDKR